MQGQGHLKGANRVHVCSDDGDSFVASLGVSEGETPQKIHLKTHTSKQNHNKTKQNVSIQTSDGGRVLHWSQAKSLRQVGHPELRTHLAP